MHVALALYYAIFGAEEWKIESNSFTYFLHAIILNLSNTILGCIFAFFALRNTVR